MTHHSELAAKLRELADRLDEGRFDAIADENIRVSFTAHWVKTIEQLRCMASLMDSRRAMSSKGHHWLTGHFGSVEVTAYYEAGLLGSTKKTQVKVVDVEETDLSILEVKP